MKSHFSFSIPRNAQKSVLAIFLFSIVFTVLSVSASSFAQTSNSKTAGASVENTTSPTTTAPAAGVVLRGDANKVPLDLQNVGVNEHLSSTLDLEHLSFTNSADGKLHPLKEYFHQGKPILLNLVYYECPMLCTMVLNGVNDGLKGLDWSVGDQFNVITISINPKDDTEDAQLKREAYVNHYAQNSGESTPGSTQEPIGKKYARDHAKALAGWQFFTGTEDQIKSIADQLGFSFNYDKIEKQYGHPAVTFILTPEGKISRYLYGITYRPRDLRLALLEASQGKIGNVFDRLLMFCYHYEPASRGYALQAIRVMQAGGASTIAFLGGWLTVFWTRQRKKKTTADAQGASGGEENK